ncbi:MAG TPA: cbb3-type cytochrome c oxidase subunit I [Steroidobacter sp.]|jgi:cytochrome c oxidase subunit 1|nr:cbb3-type cytochrome c oxidase subunit I [Steroidobacteraceae bacterium]HLS81746.1 cbb3-type cytochrome c oxidase subunit I [Steroidobacter sp.]
MRGVKSQTLYWMAITFVLFPILILLGIYMRSVQAGALGELQGWFYPMMTLHGVGMVGVWYVASMGCVANVLSKYVSPSPAIGRLAIVGSVAGVALLLACVFLGRFAGGWYFLYPLPLKGEWPLWSAVTFLASLTVLGATWLIWSLDLLRAIASKYSLPQALGWHYLSGRDQPQLPPAILIITVSLIASVAALGAGVIALALFYNEILTGAPSDALLMKNLIFFFGHTVVNLAMYLGVALVYEVLPHYAGRPWKTNKVVVISWNAVLLIVLFAYFHHLYMDFVQPGVLQYLGQIASYASAIPAAVVTIFGALLLVYRARMRWNLASILLVLGLAGWAIGGLGALIDSTISVNLRLHNTLWVPAHFHTYMVAGLVFLVVGYFYHVCQEASATPENVGYHKLLATLLVVGAYGFFMMFYLSGAYSVPRRFAAYPSELAHGATYSGVAAAFAGLFLLGFALYVVETGKRWRKALHSGV